MVRWVLKRRTKETWPVNSQAVPTDWKAFALPARVRGLGPIADRVTSFFFTVFNTGMWQSFLLAGFALVYVSQYKHAQPVTAVEKRVQLTERKFERFYYIMVNLSSAVYTVHERSSHVPLATQCPQTFAISQVLTLPEEVLNIHRGIFTRL